MKKEEKERLGALLKYEADKNYCRETVTIAKGEKLEMGAVVGVVTADGTCKAISIAEDATDGSDTAFGVLIEDVDATKAAKKAVVVARDAIVIGEKLKYPTAATEVQKKAIQKALEARGIVCRVAA